GSVPTMVIVLMPDAMARLRSNAPSGPAGVEMQRPFAPFRGRSVVRAWVLPLISTAWRLTVALFLGVVIVIFGGAASYTNRAASDESDWPAGPTIVTVKSLIPSSSSTGMIVFGALAIGTSWIAAGF